MYLGNCLIVLAGLLWAVELVPQIIKTVKTKSVKDFSLVFFIVCVCCLFDWQCFIGQLGYFLCPYTIPGYERGHGFLDSCLPKERPSLWI